jgi:DNA repair exonuclease SbcCD ATPase subunit/predicted phosphodiesterase
VRVLITADWQAEWGNLDLCDKSIDEILHICKKKKLDMVVFAGDLKNQYNPIDGRVTQWWLRTIHKLKAKGLDVIIVMGNHDRFGLYADAQNWLGTLAEAGAKVYDSPGVLVSGGSKLFILPFSNSVKRMRKWADRLAEYPTSSKRDVLVFHANLKGCSFNVLGQKSDGRLRPKDLHPRRYLACVGGDIHLPQKIGKNIYYTGSPFAVDWGESNQRKGYVVVRGTRVSRVLSSIPGLFDESWPGFRKPATGWRGARIRVHFEVASGTDYVRAMEKARLEGKRKYPGADIHVVPSYSDEESGVDADVKLSSSDKANIKAYGKETVPDSLAGDGAAIVSYLLNRLLKTGASVHEATSVKFIRAACKNFTSYKSLDVDFRRKGTVVVQGINEDWRGRSNGSGKTNYLQPIPVAMFGTTFKGQKHDSWGRRGTEEAAYVKLWLRDSRRRKVTIFRGRRPTKLMLTVNGADESSGHRTGSRNGTQGEIEQVTGFTWQTLANAVYIDESVSKAFIYGTRSERTALLNRFQNLERFALALKLVSQDRKNHERQLEKSSGWLDTYDARIDDCQTSLSRARRVKKDKLYDLKRKWYAAQRALDKAESKLEKARKKIDKARSALASKIEVIDTRAGKLEPVIARLAERIQTFTRRIHRASEIATKSSCPTCRQSINKKILRRLRHEWRRELADASGRHKKYTKRRQKFVNASIELEARYDELGLRIGQMEGVVGQASSRATSLGEQVKEVESEQSEENKSVRHYEAKLRRLKQARKLVRRSLRSMRAETAFFEYCEQAFSRDGIPAYLNAQLVPVLNRAARYYAEKFGDGEVQVRFESIDGELEPRILNAHGGESIHDQSKGERALAGLVASFALRECATKSNLLILDEPGDGLDPVNARKFATSLRDISRKFGTVFLTTFNPDILQALADESWVTVTKKNGISRASFV